MGPSTPSPANDVAETSQANDDRESERPRPRRSRWPAGTPAPVRYSVALDEAKMDPDVLKVVRRLVRHGHEAYLVGGGVRDLLLARRPKDFDVATSARPEEVRTLFRNSRIIGRRFRLVHVLFGGGKVIEVATFRKSPKDVADEPSEGSSTNGTRPDLLIRSDNAFGQAFEDALRRDFTINGLFYDAEAGEVLDWVGGMQDLKRRVVNTIGNPETRFREDPIRILRALKFAGRLDLGMTPEVYDGIVYCRDALELAARPRVSEEILRLLRGGRARRTMYIAWETGVLDMLLPELSSLLYDAGDDEMASRRVWRLLEFIDRRSAEDRPLDDMVLWTLLLLEPMKEASEGARDRGGAVASFLEPVLERLAVPRRFVDGMRRVVAVLPKIRSGRAGRFSRTDLFDHAMIVAEADLFASGAGPVEQEALRSVRAEPTPAGRRPPSGRRKRRSGSTRRESPRPSGEETP